MTMTDIDDLFQLIEDALVDNKLSAKEKELLFRKAEELGIERDVFELKLNAILTQKKQEAKKAREYARESIFGFDLRGDIIITSIILVIISVIIVIIIRSTDTNKLKRFARHNQLEYTDWQEALVNYDFNNAYALVPIYKKIKYRKTTNDYELMKGTISETEVNYLFSEGLIDRGLGVAQENLIADNVPEAYGISNSELQRIILKNFDILVAKQKYNEALKLIQNYKLVLNEESLGSISGITYISDITAMERYNSLVIPYNEVLNNLFQKVGYIQVPGFNYLELLNMFKPIARSKYVGTKRIKHITEPRIEQKIITNRRGKPKLDDRGNALTETVVIDQGGVTFYLDEDQYSFFMTNDYKEEAVKVLQENAIKY